MDLNISIEVNHDKSIARYATLAVSHFYCNKTYCYCALNSSATADTSLAANGKPLPFRWVTMLETVNDTATIHKVMGLRENIMMYTVNC